MCHHSLSLSLSLSLRLPAVGAVLCGVCLPCVRLILPIDYEELRLIHFAHNPHSKIHCIKDPHHPQLLLTAPVKRILSTLTNSLRN